MARTHLQEHLRGRPRRLSRANQQDIEEIKRLTGEIEAYADRTLAHLDKRGYDGKVTFNDLDAAIDALDRIACKYIALLTSRGYPSLEASVVFDWKRIVRRSTR